MKESIPAGQANFEAEVLKALFGGMAERGLRHAVLRNYEHLPHRVGGRDIDVAMHPDDLTACCDLVAQIVRAMGLRYANYFVDERLTQFALVRRDPQGVLQQIKIDLFISSEAYGIEVLTAENMLADLRDYNGIPVVSDRVLVLDKLIFHLLVDQRINPKYNKRFSAIAQAEGAEIASVLSRILSVSRAEALVSDLAAGKGSALMLTAAERWGALARLWVAQGHAALPRSLRFIGFRLRDSLRPHGVFLSISGPDGSGKTTVIDLVIEQLGAIYGDAAVTYAHFRPTVLWRIAEVAKKARAVETVDENYDQPHRAKPSGFTGSIARLVYYGIDYLGGYFRSVRPVLKRREVMLFDRYYHDMIADSFRSRISLPMPLLRAFGRLLPLPQYAFFIHVDPDEIHRRKQELTMERIVELNTRYGDLADRGWLIRIDNNGAPQEAAAAIVDRIVLSRDTETHQALEAAQNT